MSRSQFETINAIRELKNNINEEYKKKPSIIALTLNCHYDGIQSGFGKHPAMMQFTDNVTHSTTYGNSFKEVKENLERMRKDFGR